VRLAGADPARVVVFHSLSKRSSAPGLRSGFAAGGRGAIGAMRRLRAYGGAPSPLPLQRAAAALWRDEAHVEASRAMYVAKFEAADATLGDLPGYVAPRAGFFLWLAAGDGEAATLRLWREAGVKVLPGAYLGRATETGPNPGQGYVRVALVAGLEEVTRGLGAIRDVLGAMQTAEKV
jgi:N-succinyldiaminopimelate aminotransferase